MPRLHLDGMQLPETSQEYASGPNGPTRVGDRGLRHAHQEEAGLECCETPKLYPEHGQISRSSPGSALGPTSGLRERERETE